MDYYRDVVTEKSWAFLQELARTYPFVLIGGWAVWLYTKQLKSKDIDLIVEFSLLEALRQQYPMKKNDRLKKYEIAREEVQVDIYVPHWSTIGISCEYIIAQSVLREGFRVPPCELLVVLKLVAFAARRGSAKGRKDLLDIVSLIALPEFDFHRFKETRSDALLHGVQSLSDLIRSQTDVPELGLNRHRYAGLKKRWLSQM